MRNRGCARRKGLVAPPVSILCLGSSAALTDGGPWSSFLIDGRLLLDIPPTAVTELRRRKIDLARIECVVVSHLHADHVFGIPFLLLEYAIRCERTAPLTLVGPPGVKEFVETLCALAWRGICSEGADLRVPVTFVEASANRETSVGDVRFVAFPMAHFDLPAFGYRIAYQGRAIAYSGDTGPCAALDALVGGADVAIVELTHPDARTDRGHLNSGDVARLAGPLSSRRAKVLATHMTGTPRPIPGVTFCKPGKTYRV